MGPRLVRLSLVMLMLAVASVRAHAQSSRLPFGAAAGAGFSTPFHADFDFIASNWQVSARGGLAPHLAIEVTFDDWRHPETSVLLNQAISGPNGFLGRIARIEQTTTHEMRHIGVNVLATVSSGRVTFAAGGGAGRLDYNRRYTQASSGCDGPVQTSCGTFENEFSSTSVTGQGVVDVDVRLAKLVSVFGRYDLVVPIEDPGFGYGSLAGGVRVAFR